MPPCSAAPAAPRSAATTPAEIVIHLLHHRVAGVVEVDKHRAAHRGAHLVHQPALRQECGDRAVLRAMHFYSDDRRAAQEAGALKKGDFEAFLNMVNASGLSSSLCLQNTWSIHDPKQRRPALQLFYSATTQPPTGRMWSTWHLPGPNSPSMPFLNTVRYSSGTQAWMVR